MNDKAAKPKGEPWEWKEPVWRGIVESARAGRSLRPKALAGRRTLRGREFSFDADHETIPLRDADLEPDAHQPRPDGNRQGVPRLRALMQRAEAVPVTFFYPAVSALLHQEEVRGVAGDGHEIGIHSWIDERNTTLSYKAERDLSPARRRGAFRNSPDATRSGCEPRAGISR